MNGRYGNDDLNRFLDIVALILIVISFFVRGTALYVLNFFIMAILVLILFRAFSRDTASRWAENEKFLGLKERIFGGRRGGSRGNYRGGYGGSQYNSGAVDRDHLLYTCPKCGQKVRVPKGRGRIQIHCPKCGNDFIRRT